MGWNSDDFPHLDTDGDKAGNVCIAAPGAWKGPSPIRGCEHRDGPRKWMRLQGKKAGKHQYWRWGKIREVRRKDQRKAKGKESYKVNSKTSSGEQRSAQNKCIWFANYWWPWGWGEGLCTLWVGIKSLETIWVEGTFLWLREPWGGTGKQAQGRQDWGCRQRAFYFKKILLWKMTRRKTHRTKYTTYYKAAPRLRNRILPSLRPAEAPPHAFCPKCLPPPVLQLSQLCGNYFPALLYTLTSNYKSPSTIFACFFNFIQ